MKIAIAGASGRMGRMLIETVLNDAQATLSGALDRADSPQLGQDAGAFLGKKTGVVLTDDIERVFAESDVLIDFTRPEGTLVHLEAALRHNLKMVIGTTGFDDAQKAQLRAAGEKIGIVFAPNMSVGVNVTLKLLEFAAKQFAEGYDIEIIEAHHRHKVDAPSGTALAMGEVVAKALGPRPEGLRGVRPRRRDGRARSIDDRFCRDSRRRYRRRPHGAVCGHRRAHRDHAQVGEPSVVCAGRVARRAISSRAATPVSSTCRTCSACAESPLSREASRWRQPALSITCKASDGVTQRRRWRVARDVGRELVFPDRQGVDSGAREAAGAAR